MSLSNAQKREKACIARANNTVLAPCNAQSSLLYARMPGVLEGLASLPPGRELSRAPSPAPRCSRRHAHIHITRTHQGVSEKTLPLRREVRGQTCGVVMGEAKLWRFFLAPVCQGCGEVTPPAPSHGIPDRTCCCDCCRWALSRSSSRCLPPTPKASKTFSVNLWRGVVSGGLDGVGSNRWVADGCASGSTAYTEAPVLRLAAGVLAGVTRLLAETVWRGGPTQA